MKPRPLNAEEREEFERAFSAGTSGCRRTCKCGITYFDDGNSGCDWEEGELEALRNDPKAVGLDYSVGDMEFEGADYVNACDCWLPRATAIYRFIEGHDTQIADLINTRKKHYEEAAKRMPSVEL